MISGEGTPSLFLFLANLPDKPASCVPSTDVLGLITEAIDAHLWSATGCSREELLPKLRVLSPYIEAIEFTTKQDDGALPQNLHKADIVLAGVSRTGKMPLSIYLAQKGYKVANAPIVMGVNMPKMLYSV
ncbi:hypothetical protein MLD38_016793 [Melastoma candidum]|uniref:Uncharacterized protein n=1 Tax=Melastoma candidum TaxID=119954 RepID=A0ACB9QS12_9MYRT|nr:hypothetical protein MLD38_016793 [Melastoma candidum]